MTDLKLARELGVRTSLHVGVGLLGEQRSITELHRRGQLGPDLIYVHCNTCTDAELRLIAETGGHTSISPRVEMQMGHGYPATGRLCAAGVTPSLSVDVVSGVGGSLFAEMRGTLEAERGWQHHAALSRGEALPELTITTREVVAMATIEGARTLGLDDRLGSLTPGKQADIVLLDTTRPNLTPVNHLPAAITLADNENVDTVLIAGRVVKQDGRLLGHDLADVRDRARLRGTGFAGPAADVLVRPEAGPMIDRIFVNGLVWPGRGLPEASALLARDWRIGAVGTDAEIRALAGPGTEVTDLGGRRVIPGLIDGHMHAVRGGSTWGERNAQVDPTDQRRRAAGVKTEIH